MTINIEKMMKMVLKEPGLFNHYPYEDKAVANQFVFAIEGLAYDSIFLKKAIVCRIVPKILWDKKKSFFTEEINLTYLLGDNSVDMNGTGNWLLPDLSHDHLDCANQLVEKGFIWSKSLQEALDSEFSNDAEPWDNENFQVVPHESIATQIYKPMNDEIELEIFENRLGVNKHGLEKALLNWFAVIRTAPKTKEKIILDFLKKHKVPHDAIIDNYYKNKRIATTVCWLDKSEILEYYINDIDKNLVDEYGRSLLTIAEQYKCKKSKVVLLKHGFK